MFFLFTLLKKNMKLKTLLLVTSLLVVIYGKSQLDSQSDYDGRTAGFYISLSSLKNSSAASGDSLRSVGPYLGIGVELMKNSYEAGNLRYFLSSKGLTTDLLKAARILFKGEAFDNQLEISGLFWGRLGINLYANDNLCIGAGGNLSDYILDIPKFQPAFNPGLGALKYEEPSGWHITAGPTLFVDYAYQDFVLNTISSYNFGFYHDKINNDYKNFIDLMDGYETPNFLNILFKLNHSSGAYLSFEYTKVIDNGIVGSKLSRKDFLFGWRFNM
jgi:hypothetical protein